MLCWVYAYFLEGWTFTLWFHWEISVTNLLVIWNSSKPRYIDDVLTFMWHILPLKQIQWQQLEVNFDLIVLICFRDCVWVLFLGCALISLSDCCHYDLYFVSAVRNHGDQTFSLFKHIRNQTYQWRSHSGALHIPNEWKSMTATRSAYRSQFVLHFILEYFICFIDILLISERRVPRFFEPISVNIYFVFFPYVYKEFGGSIGWPNRRAVVRKFTVFSNSYW